MDGFEATRSIIKTIPTTVLSHASHPVRPAMLCFPCHETPRVEMKQTLIQNPLSELEGVVDTNHCLGPLIFSPWLRIFPSSGIGRLIRASNIDVGDFL